MATVTTFDSNIIDYVAPDSLSLNSLSLLAVPVTLDPNTDNYRGYENFASYSSYNSEKYSVFSFQGKAGATYDFGAESCYTPDIIVITNNLGKAIGLTYDDTVGAISSEKAFLFGFVAPYSGTYYVAITLDQSYSDKSGGFFIGEDLDTANNIDATTPTFVNHLPTGEIKISGTAKQDESLTVASKLADEDSLGDYEYQWLSNGVEITDATLETYKVLVSDIGKTISVKVSYIDGEGTLETVASSATAIVTGKSATAGNDLLIGTNGNDKISGLAGNDTLVGGLGVDNLTGGLGADVFKFSAINETGKTSATRDVITDFKHSEGDKIDLSGIDANSVSYGDQAFKFIGSKSFSGKAGEVRFDSTNKILYGNVNNDKMPDFAIQLNGVKSLVVDDFVL